MPTIRERVGEWLIGESLSQTRALQAIADEFSHAMTHERVVSPAQASTMLAELDPRLVDMFRSLSNYEILGMYGTSGVDALSMREAAVTEANWMYDQDVITQYLINLWTDFGFGLSLEVVPRDEIAQEVWDEFWTASRNSVVLGERDIHDLSTNLLNDGELFFSITTSMLDGQSTIRVIPSLEIKEIVFDPEDNSTPVFYKRVYQPASQDQPGVIYYPDWRVDEDTRQRVARDLPVDGAGVVLATEVREKTEVNMVAALHRKRYGRGWPLMKAGFPWNRVYKAFLQDRAAIERAAAAYLDKVKAKTGSRGIDALKTQLESTLARSDTYRETNPPPAAGSVWLENDVVERTRMGQGTGATDAQTDGAMMLAQVGLGASVYPHYLGRGEAFRLATACYDDETEVLTEHGWKKHTDCQDGEKIAVYNDNTGTMHYEVPEKLLSYDYIGPMVAIAGRSVDAMVTPNHRMYVLNENSAGKPWAKTEYEILRADELPGRFALCTSALLDNRAIERGTFAIPGYSREGGIIPREYPPIEIPMDDWLCFLGWWIAEGWLERYGNTHTVALCVKDGTPDADTIRALVATLPFGFCEDKNKGNTRFRCTSKPLHNWLLECCGTGCQNKRIPDFVFQLTTVQQLVLLNALWCGDGHRGECKHDFVGTLSTTSKQLADGVQRLILEIGDWAVVRISYNAGSRTGKGIKTNRTCYSVHWTRQIKRSLQRSRNCQTLYYNGQVHCFKVSTGIYITRRNGCALIAGNTSMETPIFRAFNRYRNFWASVWSDVATIIIDMAVQHGNYKVEDTDVDIAQDAILSQSVETINAAVTVIEKASGLGLVSPDVGELVIEQVLKTTLALLGIRNIDDILNPPEAPEGELPPEEAPPMVPEEAVALEGWRQTASPFALTSLQESQAAYQSRIRGLAAGLWRGSISEYEFVDSMVTLISQYLTKAWNEGAAQVGILPDELTDDEIAARTNLINTQYNYIVGLSEFILSNRREDGALLRSLYPTLSMWANRYSDAFTRGMVMARADEKLIWVLGPTEKHCDSCAGLEGKVKRASYWDAHILPRDTRLDCNGYRCKCEVLPTDLPISRGRLPGGF